MITEILSAIAGSALTLIIQSVRHRLQKMHCHYLDDEILSKIPQLGVDNTIQENLYCKKFEIINTTNKDIRKFSVLFQFDPAAIVKDSYTQSKEGYDIHKIIKNKKFPNQAEILIQNFNRGDSVQCVFNVANITNNSYYVTESNCLGFKIKCKDKRRAVSKSKSNKSNQILVTKPIS